MRITVVCAFMLGAGVVASAAPETPFIIPAPKQLEALAGPALRLGGEAATLILVGDDAH